MSLPLMVRANNARPVGVEGSHRSDAREATSSAMNGNMVGHAAITAAAFEQANCLWIRAIDSGLISFLVQEVALGVEIKFHRSCLARILEDLRRLSRILHD